MTLIGGVFIGVSVILLVMFLLFRMMARSDEDWGLYYNFWERSSAKQAENEKRGIARQNAIATFFRRSLPMIAIVFVAALGLVVLGAVA